VGYKKRQPSTPPGILLSSIVARLGGTLRGSGSTLISRVASLKSAQTGDISFMSDARYRQQLGESRASAVILPESPTVASPLPAILCADPYLYFAEVANLLNPPQPVVPGRHASAVVEVDAMVPQSVQIDAGVYIGHGVRIGEGVAIGAGCCVSDDVEIGAGSRLHANVTVYKGSRIGQRAILHSGSVIGADGFGMALKNGRWLKIPQTGRVVIGDDVEVGANTAIDRGALDDTVIEDGVKLDNLIQVGHNVRIGAHTAIAGCVGIAGSASIGRHCTIGGGAVILGHLELADHVHISAATLITKSIRAPGTYTGAFPFDEHRKWGRTAASVRNLGELVVRVRRLEALLEAADTANAGQRAEPGSKRKKKPATAGSITRKKKGA